MSRFFDRISRPEQLLDVAARGDARADRPGRDRRRDDLAAAGRAVGGGDWPAAFFERRGLGDRAPLPIPPMADALALMSAARERPSIIAGGGVHYSEAWAELAEFAEAFSIPVTETSAGKGAVRRRRCWRSAASAATGTPAARARARCRPRDLHRHAPHRLPDRLAPLPHPDVRFASINIDVRDGDGWQDVAVLATPS